MNKINETQIPIPITSLCSIIKVGLENLDAFDGGPQKMRVRNLKVMNVDTLLCEIHSSGVHSTEVKTEIAIVMSFLSAFFKDDPYGVISFRYFAVRAFNELNTELIYAISSRESAGSISRQNSIEWLKTTLFQENTDDYRLARAKTIIFDIENGLRKGIRFVLENKFGSDWWNLALDEKISNSVKSTYLNQFGMSSEDGNVLINYTFPFDLKKIVSADWGSFKHIFDKKSDFEDVMVEFNTIRREEAHNRMISEQHLKDLERIYEFLLTKIATLYPDIILSYLVDNWKLKLKSIFNYLPSSAYTMDEFSVLDDEGKRQLIIKDCQHQIDTIKDMIIKLKSVLTPVSKKQKHEEMIILLDTFCGLQEQKLNCALSSTWDAVPAIISALHVHGEKMNVFSKEFLLEES